MKDDGCHILHDTSHVLDGPLLSPRSPTNLLGVQKLQKLNLLNHSLPVEPKWHPIFLRSQGSIMSGLKA